MHVPKCPLGALGVAAGRVQLEDNALISSPWAGKAGSAIRPRLSVPSTLFLSPLPTWFQPIPDDTHCMWTWQLVHQPRWACRICPQSRGNAMWWQWAEQISPACQIKVGSGSICQSPQNTPVFYGAALRFLVTCQKWQLLWVILPFLYWALLKDLWKPCKASMSVAQDAWCVRMALLSRKHSLFVRGNLEISACEKQGKGGIYWCGVSWHYLLG